MNSEAVLSESSVLTGRYVIAATISAFEARVVDQDKRIAELEQITSFHLVGLGIGLGLGLLLFKWMGKA